MNTTGNTLRAVLLPPAAEMTLHTVFDLWMLRLEMLCDMPREDILLYFRLRLLEKRPAGFGTARFIRPVHPDELEKEELFTFMWHVRHIVRTQLRITLDFNTENTLESLIFTNNK